MAAAVTGTGIMAGLMMMAPKIPHILNNPTPTVVRYASGDVSDAR
jgi:hypothetical protein